MKHGNHVKAAVMVDETVKVSVSILEEHFLILDFINA